MADDFTVLGEYPFEFYGTYFTIVLDNQYRLWCPLPLLCQALSLDPSSQVARIQRTPAMMRERVLRPVTYTHYPYGKDEFRPREVQALRLDWLPFWLGGLDVGRIPNEKVREQIITYQIEFAFRAWAAFRSEILPEDMRAELDTLMPPQQQAFFRLMDDAAKLRAQVEQKTQEHDRKLKQHDDRLRQAEADLQQIKAKLLATNTLNPAQMKQVQEMVRLVARVLERKGKTDPYGTVHQSIKEAFSVGSYAQIAEADFPKLRKYLAQIYQGATPPGTPLPGIFQAPDQRRMI